MKFVADDSTNRSIWTESTVLQRRILKGSTLPLAAAAQQVMPRGDDVKVFSMQNPLPWVPDLCGCSFGERGRGVLVVGSSYNGFLERYSDRSAVMPLRDYLNAKNDDHAGLERFCRSFVEYVVERDEDYYQPILRDLLHASGCPIENSCLTDLCKASFVRRGKGLDTAVRGDVGADSVIRTFWEQWLAYVSGVGNTDGPVPLPYKWIWHRMQQCEFIVALGTIAEYGILKIFNYMADNPKVWARADELVTPDHPTLTIPGSAWKYGYASYQRLLKDWLAAEDWWILSDSREVPRWYLLPVYHPSPATRYNKDIGYRRTAPRLHQMLIGGGPSEQG